MPSSPTFGTVAAAVLLFSFSYLPWRSEAQPLKDLPTEPGGAPFAVLAVLALYSKPSRRRAATAAPRLTQPPLLVPVGCAESPAAAN